jgi:hypothetical protein
MVTPFSLFRKKNYTDDERLMLDRWRICRECPFLMADNVCAKCGCFMKLKVKLKEAKCPEGHW